jgi:hypothetical protein
MIVILLQAAEACLHESEHALQDAEGMLHLDAYSGLGSVLTSLDLVDPILGARAPRGHVLGFGRGLASRLALSLIGSVAPHLAFLTVQKVGNICLSATEAAVEQSE